MTTTTNLEVCIAMWLSAGIESTSLVDGVIEVGRATIDFALDFIFMEWTLLELGIQSEEGAETRVKVVGDMGTREQLQTMYLTLVSSDYKEGP